MNEPKEGETWLHGTERPSTVQVELAEETMTVAVDAVLHVSGALVGGGGVIVTALDVPGEITTFEPASP